MVGTEVEYSAGVDTTEVPSAEWGWSRINYRAWHLIGLGIVGFLLLMLRGNHVGHVEDIYLIGFATAALVVVLRDIRGRQKGWLK